MPNLFHFFFSGMELFNGPSNPGFVLIDLPCFRVDQKDRNCRHVVAVHYQSQVHGGSVALERPFPFLLSQQYIKECLMARVNPDEMMTMFIND